MHHQKVAVFTTSTELFQKIKRIIPAALAEVRQLDKVEGSLPLGITIALVDGKWPNDLHRLFGKLAAQAIYTVLVDDEKHIGDNVPEVLSEGLVEDLLLTPIRPLELLGKIKHVSHLARVNDLFAVNADLKTLIERFEEDIRTTRAIQRSLIPEKFQPVHGLKVTHRYLSGMKSGGDYLDFFEFEDKTHVGVLMSDSSGYGLSSAFMSIILRLAVKLSKDEVRHPSRTVAKIFEELQLTMKPTENLSIFYGILNRKTFEMTYTSGGNIRFLHQGPGADEPSRAFSDRTLQAHALVKGEPFVLQDHSVKLLPEDRIVLFSDGFGETFENEKAIEKTLAQNYREDAISLVNELSFRIKKRLESDDDMPEQDCSVMIIDIEKRAMRLAK